MPIPCKVMQLVLSLEVGGAEKLVCDIIRRIDPQRISPVVCCLDTVGSLGEELQREGYRVYALNRKPGLDWRLIPRLSALLQQEAVDVIHAHQYSPYFYGLMAALFLDWVKRGTKKPKLIVTEHGKTYYPPRKKIKRMLINPLLSLFTEEIITISEHTKMILSTCENYPARRIKVVYNGIDLKRFAHPVDPAPVREALGIVPDAKVIGIVARLDPLKNHAMLLRAFQRVVRHVPEAYLLIVGDGPERQHLNALAQTLDVQKQVLFLGNRHDVPDLLHSFDIFALASFTEGTSVSLLEAMGAGLPIVATRVGGNPEVIQDRETGYLVENNDEHDMAEKLLSLLQDQGLRERMGQAGYQRVQAMFSLERMIHTYTGLYGA